MKVSIKENVYIYFVIILFLIPFQWLFAWLIAVCIHEFSHWLSVRLLGGKVYSLEIGMAGANMVCETLSKPKQILSVLSGPIGGFIIVLTGTRFPRLALCSWVLSVYNLLPLLPLDGGRALQILMNAHPSFHTIEKITLIVLFLCALYLAIPLQLGLFPLIILALLWLKNRKKPCKEWVYKVQ